MQATSCAIAEAHPQAAFPPRAQNAKRFRKVTFKSFNRSYKKKDTAQDDDTAAYLATIYVSTDASGEALETVEEAEEPAAAEVA